MAGKKPTLRKELIKMTISISGATMLILGLILSVVVFHQATARAREDMRFYMESVQEQLERQLQFLETTVVYIRQNQTLNNFLKGLAEDSGMVKEQLEQGANLFSEGNLVSESYPLIRDFYIFNERMQTAENHFYPLSVLEKKELRRDFVKLLNDFKKEKAEFSYRTRKGVLDLCFRLYDEQMEPMGYCAVAIDQEGIGRIFEPLEKYETYYWGLLNQKGEQICGTRFPVENLLELKEASNLNPSKNAFVYQIRSNSFGMISAVMIPKDKLFLNIEPMFLMMLVIFTVTILVMVVASIFFSSKISRPLRDIVSKIRQMGKGDFHTKLEEYKISELQEISDSFNDTTEKIDQLIKEVYENQLLAREARIQYIQAQMNPHFMFNVLSMISMRLKMNGDEELYKMVSAFSGLMRGKIFRKGEIEIPLKDEMEIVEFYLYLQGQRFRDMITYEICWDSEELKECKIPRLCIEPLVENSMLHGLEPKGREGYIRVEIHRQGEDKLSVVVEDDGIGFDLEKWNENLQKEGYHPRVGIMNIQRLIQNLYGEGYGMTVESKPGEGTRVELILPYTLEGMVS